MQASLKRLVALFFGLVLALLLAEVGLRLWPEPLAQPRLPVHYDLEALTRLEAGQGYVAFDRELGWLPTPSVERVGEDVRYRHNASGMRAEVEYSQQPRPGVRRYAAYGDSFTYCEEVKLENCWTTMLQDDLRRSEVLNFGVPGYAPDQAWLRYQRDGPAWQPCAVLIGHMTENINRVVNRFRPFYYWGTGIPLPKPRFVLEHGQPVLLPSPVESTDQLRDPRWVETNLGPGDSWYFPGTFVANPLDSFELISLARTARFRFGRDEGVEWTPEFSERAYRPGQEAFDVLVAVLSGFAADVRAAGASPVVLIFPWRGEIARARDGQPLPHRALLDALRERDVPFIDFSEALGAQTRRTTFTNVVQNHYRPIGNEVVERTLLRELPPLTAATCGR